MTGPAEKPSSGDKHSGGLAQVVRWLTEERPIAGPDDGGFAGAPRRAARWTYGDPPARPPKPDVELDALREVRIGPAPRCAVAGETIALSVSLVDSRGGIYLGWPIKLEWSSSDPVIASVNDYGIVEVNARGRVELTCTCEGKSGSVSLTVVDPEVAVAVGLPVPAHAHALPTPSASAPALAAKRRAIPEAPPPPHRRSIERGSVRRGLFAPLALSRGTRRFMFRLAVGAVTGAVVAVVLAENPEEYFVVNAEASRVMTAQAMRRAAAAIRRPATVAGSARAIRTASASTSSAPGAPLAHGDTLNGPTRTGGRTVAEAAGTTTIASPSDRSAPVPTVEQPAGAPEASRAVAPTVSRVVLASSPSQLLEGESVRLSAAGVDDRGEAVAGRGVTWKSEDGDIAVVDENGVVTARRAGTVTIAATSEGRTGRVTLTVGPRRASTPAAEAPTRNESPRETGAAGIAQVMRARVDEFVQALRERNGGRVAALYNPESPEDRKNLQRLLERLRRPEARLRASDAQLGTTEIGELEAAGEFQVPMSWTTPFGRVRNQTSTFRAVLEPSDGGWRVVAIRVVGKID